MELANIGVYFVLLNALYDDPQLMKNIIEIRRFIDDGVGMNTMTKSNFEIWKCKVSQRVFSDSGLLIKETDWNEPSQKYGFVNFLAVSFAIDQSGTLQTDLYRKPTDSRSYLNFGSCHPNYTFSGIVYSQGHRLRCIINNFERLSTRLSELETDFKKCSCPASLLTNIFD